MRWLAYDVLPSSSSSASNTIDWRMGCAYSQSSQDDHDSKVFEAINIDSEGNAVSAGKIKVTKTDISFLYNNNIAVWPLRCLRRYGYDEQIFSFEAGRRCRSGPGIYAFTCEKADQLFNLVQQNILVCTNNTEDRNSDDRTSTERPIQRVIIPEPNYLDPTPARSNKLPFSQSHNGRLCSIGSSSGPMSPQGTMGTPSPPPLLPPPPSYANELEISHNISSGDHEHNNNKSQGRRSMQRSHTVSSSTSSSVFLSSEQVSAGQAASSSEIWTTSQDGGGVGGSASAAVPSSVPSYMNVDLGSDACPLSPAYSNCDSSTPTKHEPTDSLDPGKNGADARAYMNINISPDQSEKAELVLPITAGSSKPRPPALPIPPMQLELDEEVRHSYANLGTNEIEALKKRHSIISCSERLPTIPVQTPPPYSTSSREVRYAVLNLDKKEPPVLPSKPSIKTASNSAAATPTSTTTVTIATTSEPATLQPGAAVDPRQNGYVTIDFDKTNALSHSVNSNKSSDIIPDEGSRKTRHNSTISELMAS